MPKNNQNFNQELEGFLRASGFDNLSTKDVDGDDVPSAKEADQFIFQYSKNGKDYGNVVITTHGGKVSVYYNQNLNRGPDGSDTGWTKFLMKLKDWALRNGQMEFKAGNIDNIGYEMKKRKQQKREENLSEGYYGTRHTSYSDNTPKIKMIIKHSKSIDEGDQRYRYIDKIFLENELGERVLIPTKKPSVGRAFARHLAEGGQYNDERWKHIREIAEDINSLSGFVRATKTKQFNEGVMQVVNEAANHYQQLRETIKKLENSRGYNMYFENWQPQLMEQDSDQDFSSMFVSNRLDPRIEQALPVLNKLNIKVNEIQEATEFEQWANSIVEGQSPAMDHKVKEFAKLLSEPDSLPVGADAMNVKGQLEDLIDDQDHRNALFDELDDLAYSDPDNDSIPTIISFLQKHKDEKFYGEVLDHVGEKTDIPSDQEIATEPETATQASAPATPPAPQTPPVSGAAGAAAPFMPQPLAEKVKKPVQRNFVAKNAQRSGAGAHGKKGFQRYDKHKKKLGEEGLAEGSTTNIGSTPILQKVVDAAAKYGFKMSNRSKNGQKIILQNNDFHKWLTCRIRNVNGKIYIDYDESSNINGLRNEVVTPNEFIQRLKNYYLKGQAWLEKIRKRDAAEKNFVGIRVEQYPYGKPSSGLKAAVKFLNRNGKRGHEYFDFPEYADIPDEISNQLMPDEVDFIQDRWDEVPAGKQGVAEGSLTDKQQSYWDNVAKEKKNKERDALRAKKAEREKTPIGKAEKYWAKEGVAEGLNEFAINRGDGDDDDHDNNRGPGLTRQEFKNALKLALGYDISGVDVSTFEGGMLRIEVNGERRIVPCNKLGVKDAANFVKRTKQQGVAEGLDPDTQRLEQEVRDALANGDDYTAKSLVKMAQTAADRNYLRKIIRQEMYGTGPGQGGVAEGYSELDNLKKKFEGTIERILQRAKEEGRDLTDREKKAIAILKGEQQGVAEGSDKTPKITFVQTNPGSNSLIDIFVDGRKTFLAAKTVGPGFWSIYPLGPGTRTIGGGGSKSQLKKTVLDYLSKQGVAEGLTDSNTQDAIVNTVERLFRENEINDYGALEAIRQGVKHHFSKPGATAESAIEGILKILDKRMRKSGNYVDLGRFKGALRQGVAHQMKKQGVAEGLNEFATGSGGGGDDILKTLAAQWLNGGVSSGDLDSDIQSQEKVERRLEKGVTCPDGVKRKLYIDYSDDYEGVVIYSDDDWSITYKQDDLHESKNDESLNAIKRLSGLK